MTALVTANVPLVAGAPGGINKLRCLVIDLAVRGLLTRPKDAGGADAVVTAQPNGANWPFSIPAHWRWYRLSELQPSYQNGASSRGEASGVPVTVIRLADIKGGAVSLDDSRTLTLARSTVVKYELSAGDVLVIRVNGSADLVGRFIVCRDGLQAIPCDHFIRVRFPADLVDSAYLKIVGDSGSTRSAISDLFVSTAGQKTVNQGHIGSLWVPLPPLVEQHRIVAKVDELMALCDRLEAEQADAEAAHAKLVEALLASLTQARDAADFRASWQQLAEHFHTLFTTEASVDALKQTVLQLGVSGKLALQYACDESATDLLNRLGIKALAHELQGWASVPLGDLGTVLGGATPSKANVAYWTGDIPWVSPKDMKRAFIADAEDHVSPAAIAGSALKLIPEGSILMVVRGMILAHSFPVALTEKPVTINQDMKALVPPAELARYLLLVLQASKHDIVALVDRSSHGTCKLVSEKLWSHTVAVPPLAEQARIVAKVDELLSLCDQLRANLAQARTRHEHLASALVEQAVA